MTETQSIQTSAERAVPSASEFTSSPLRNRLRVELDAPVAEVWDLIGDLSRFPEYSAGLERVEAELDESGSASSTPATSNRTRRAPRGL
jgi:uncharacterized membrane protein